MQGLVDLEVEIAKCDKKLDISRTTLQKMIKVETQPDYEDTVPANVRLANSEKVSCLRPHLACTY
jgi:valyl-tRNA synthetase